MLVRNPGLEVRHQHWVLDRFERREAAVTFNHYVLAAALEYDGCFVSQVADLADAFNERECVFIDEEVFDDVCFNLRVGYLQANVLRVEVNFFQDIQLDRGPFGRV